MHKSLYLFLLFIVCAGTINITMWDKNSDDCLEFHISGENLSLDGYADMGDTSSLACLSNVSRLDEYVLHTGEGYATSTENLTN